MNGVVSIRITDAARVAVRGRVTNSDGTAIRNATVVLTDAAGNMRTAITNAIGLYQFDDVEAGHTFVVAVSVRKSRFEPRIIQVVDNLLDLNFAGVE